MRKPKQQFEHMNEVLFIQSINPDMPPDTFNRDPKVFKKYREMQAGFAEADGHDDLAQQMRMRGSW